jgi:hypothetical protein
MLNIQSGFSISTYFCRLRGSSALGTCSDRGLRAKRRTANLHRRLKEAGCQHDIVFSTYSSMPPGASTGRRVSEFISLYSVSPTWQPADNSHVRHSQNMLCTSPSKPWAVINLSLMDSRKEVSGLALSVVALRVRPSSTRISKISTYLAVFPASVSHQPQMSAALVTAVRPRVILLTSAPCAHHSRTNSAWPPLAAQLRSVIPSMRPLLTSAPCAHSPLTTSA